MKVSIYSLADEKGEVKYVGQTRCPLKRRRREHINESRRGKGRSRKAFWVISTLNRGGDVVIKELEVTDEKHASSREDYWIEYFKNNGCKLVNMVSAGEPHYPGSKIIMEELNEDNLREQYCERKLTTDEIAKSIGVSKDTVLERLKSHGIEIRQSRKWKKRFEDLDEGWLRECYEVKKMSTEVMSIIANCSPRLIRDSLERIGVVSNGYSLGAVHKHLLIPLLESNNISHRTQFVVKVKNKKVTVDEFLPYYRVFIDVLQSNKYGYSGSGNQQSMGILEEKREFLHSNYPDVKIFYFLDDDFRDGTAERLVEAIRSGRSVMVPLRVPGYDKVSFYKSLLFALG